MILSFGYTSPALLAGAKSVTRRDWKQQHADRFRPGQIVDAYDRSQRVGGRKIAEIRIAESYLPIAYPIATMPDSDYEAEGFRWLYEHYSVPPRSAPFPDFSLGSFRAWRASGAVLYVVRFELVSVLADAAAIRDGEGGE